ncbi:hypothetical protein CWS20_13300 [Cytobacillus horneckiae]|uniref:Uncharacterized protein n=1 Tax=Cytobacillus horneckiae TaxID=549687 RepID=A0A2N0ZG98_9BACI|nr:hypothetical protein [Cytobacillus horneckiae]PKG28540.1 hypothetical protein CWS20_13300 [Cytobacillus horneckiae]
MNLFFTVLYLLSRTAGKILVVLSFPFLGLTQYAASAVYQRFNWFVARILLLCYLILLLILVIIFFMLFSYFADMS